jgi:hypothetical protein
MANTLGGVAVASIAQRTLDVLIPRLQQFSNFTTDFGGEVEQGTTTISTRLPTATTAGTIGTGYVAARQDVTTTVKTLTLSDVYGNVIGFLDNEWNGSKINLIDAFIVPNVNAICDGIMTAALNLVTASAVGNTEDTSKKTIATAAALDYQAAADLATIVTNRNVPSAPRFLMLKPTYYAGLAKDSAIAQAFSIGGTDVIQRNVLPNVAGFSVSQYVNFPANSENLVGVCGGKQGIMVASRVPQVVDFPGMIQNITDPETGFTLQMRKWYSADEGRHFLSLGCQYAVSIGNGAQLVRIVSA